MATSSTISVPLSSVSGGQRKAMSESMLPAEEIQRLSLGSVFDTIIARAIVRKLARSAGYTPLDQVRISTAVYEIARDMMTYAGRGEIIVSWDEATPQRKGLRFLCHDCGLNDSRLAEMFQTGGNETDDKLNFLGLRRLVDEFVFTKDLEYGNCVTVIKWMGL